MLTVRSFRLNDVSHCQWSGGFRIDQDDSFHINMRFVVVVKFFLYEEMRSGQLLNVGQE